MKVKRIVLTEARKTEIQRAYKVAQKMYMCALDMLELAQKCADDYNLTEQEMREVILSPILLFIVSRKNLTDKERKALMQLMIYQATEIYEATIGSLFDEEDEDSETRTDRD